MRNLLSFLLIFSSSTFTVSAQNEPIIEVIEEVPPVQDEFIREEFNKDGTYVKYRDEKIIASGFHVKRVLNGEYKAFNGDGSTAEVKHFKLGILDGEQVSYFSNETTRTSYSNGIQIGYETITESGGLERRKSGPYFTGKKKNHVFIKKEFYRYNDEFYENYDTIFFQSNSAPEIHRWSLGKDVLGQVTDTFSHVTCKMLNYTASEYSNETMQMLFDDQIYRIWDFDSKTLLLPRETVVYRKNGLFDSKSFPNYWLEFHNNGVLKDSVINMEDPDYNHFRFDETGKVIFKAKKDPLDRPNSYRYTYDYFRNGAILYSITSLNRTPERILSTNDSVIDLIKKGQFKDYYGTIYFTNPQGEIDTSYSEFIFPIRFKNDLKPGRYYYLNSQKKEYWEAIDVTEKGIDFITVQRDSTSVVKKREHMEVVFQKDTLYQMYTRWGFQSSARKIVMANNRLFAVDWSQRLEHNQGDDIEQLAILSYQDTSVSFKSTMLTEKEFQAALKLKDISEMPKKDFQAIFLVKMEPIRLAERNAQKSVPSDKWRNLVQLQSRQLFQVLYEMGYNPYITEKQFSELMDSYQWTDEEKRNIKKIIR